MPSSRLKTEVARVLKDEGYISNFKVSEDGKKKVLRIVLRYGTDGENVITTIDRVSRPGRRVYVGAQEIPKVPATERDARLDLVLTEREVINCQQA